MPSFESARDEPKKVDIEQVEDGHPDKEVAEERITLTEEDDARIRRKTDKRILVILCWIYFLQIFDKVIFGLGNVFGLSKDLGLVGDQYSFAGSIHAIAQLAWQPLSSYILVRVPARPLMTFLVIAWGASAAGMAAATNHHGIWATRFLLGLFEAGCLPLFSMITAQWYRRSEQPIRIAAWYGTNGIASIVAGLLAWALGHLPANSALKPWQALYLFGGLLTIVSGPLVWYLLDNDIQSARFLTEYEKKQALERLRANQTGTGTREWKWAQVLEVFVDPKSLIWLAIATFVNTGAAVTNVFGPTLIRNFGFDPFVTTLLSMPFGALQTIAILIGCYCAYKFRIKSAVLTGLMIIVVAGCVMIYTQAVNPANFKQGVALGGYYLLAFLFGGNPLIVSWMVANTAGQTKKSVTMALFNSASAVGNIVGPLLFKSTDGNKYYPSGVRSVMGIFVALVGCIGIQVVLLWLYNKQRERQRVAHGEPAKIHDSSMDSKYQAADPDLAAGAGAQEDVTDIRNRMFTYVY